MSRATETRKMLEEQIVDLDSKLKSPGTSNKIEISQHLDNLYVQLEKIKVAENAEIMFADDEPNISPRGAIELEEMLGSFTYCRVPIKWKLVEENGNVHPLEKSLSAAYVSYVEAMEVATERKLELQRLLVKLDPKRGQVLATKLGI